MNSLLTIVSALVWGVLYGSIVALVVSLITWPVLRWSERCNVVFNRVYLACLIWTLLGMLMIAIIALHTGHTRPPWRALLTSDLLRGSLVLDMLFGFALIWRLTPRIDARRVRPASACLAAGVVMAVGFGVGTVLV